MRALRWFLGLFAALALLGTAVPASAGVAPGTYQIVSARWGTPQRNVDVTGLVAEYARSGSRVRVDTDSMRGDPDVGAHKTLRIFAREADGTPRTFDIGEGGYLNAADFASWTGPGAGYGTGGYADWNGPAPGQPGTMPGGDRGQYVIVGARWGTPQHNVDVTSRLKDLARQDRQFRIVDNLFGQDPDVGVHKTLRIFARDSGGAVRTFDYPEFGTVDGAQFVGWGGGTWGNGGGIGNWEGGAGGAGGDQGQFQIVQARWGTPAHNIDVTDRLKMLARSDDRVRVTNGLFGDDPDIGAHKTLRIYARGPDGATRTFDYPEGGTVDGAQFTAWRGGDWGRGNRWNGWEVPQQQRQPQQILPVQDR